VRIFSGIQPTGRRHLGNYIGAIRQYVEGQDRGEAIYCVVDLHATTVAYNPEDLRRNVLDTAAMLLAAGLDPERCILFRQGDVSEHTELCWLLCAVTAHGDLNRMHQFREKSARQRELVSAGLFLYPVLQAADVLAYKTDEVPVGDDQRQHLELTRDIAIRFNQRFGDTFVVPRHRIPRVGARIMDLQAPEQKMSTTAPSELGVIFVTDDEATIAKKLRTAVTDSGTEVRRAPEKPGISNLVEVLAVIRGSEPEAVEAEFAEGGYGRFKQAVAEEVAAFLGPVRERYLELRADEPAIERVLQDGAEKARGIAAATLTEARLAMGVGTQRPRVGTSL
jgi:tryptophanyl-tRNA synthetase